MWGRSYSSQVRENKEEEVPERNATFYLYHPCHFLGLEIGTNKREHKSSVVEPSSSDSEEYPITPENIASNKDKKSCLEVLICEEQSAKQECSTSQGYREKN